MASDQSTADKLIDALGQLGYLDEDLTAFRLQRAFISTGSMRNLSYNFIKPEDDAKWNTLTRDFTGDWFTAVPSGTPIFDGVDRKEDIDKLGSSSMAYVMSKIDDPWGFKDLCNKVSNYFLGPVCSLTFIRLPQLTYITGSLTP